MSLVAHISKIYNCSEYLIIERCRQCIQPVECEDDRGIFLCLRIESIYNKITTGDCGKNWQETGDCETRLNVYCIGSQ